MAGVKEKEWMKCEKSGCSSATSFEVLKIGSSQVQDSWMAVGM